MGIGRSELLLPGLVTPGNRGKLGGARSPLKSDADFQKTADLAKSSVIVNAAGASLETSTKQAILGFYNQLGNNSDPQNFPRDEKAKQARNAYVTQKNQLKQDAQEQVSRLLGVDYYV